MKLQLLQKHPVKQFWELSQKLSKISHQEKAVLISEFQVVFLDCALITIGLEAS